MYKTRSTWLCEGSGNYGIEEISISLQGLCRVLVRNFQSSRDRAKNASGII